MSQIVNPPRHDVTNMCERKDRRPINENGYKTSENSGGCPAVARMIP